MSNQEKSAIEAVLNGVNRALYEKDTDQSLSHYADDTVLFSLPPPLVADTSDMSGMSDWFATWDGPLIVEHRDFKITVDGDVAFAHGLANMRGRKTDGQDVDLWYRRTFGLRRIDGAWKIVHEHESVPFLMDGSNLAALDLKP